MPSQLTEFLSRTGVPRASPIGTIRLNLDLLVPRNLRIEVLDLTLKAAVHQILSKSEVAQLGTHGTSVLEEFPSHAAPFAVFGPISRVQNLRSLRTLLERFLILKHDDYPVVADKRHDREVV